jgi:uncharacterized membrane protein YfcA
MDYLLLLPGAFLAGLVDAVVGGGGLIQLPLLLAVFPQAAIPVLFGTNKLSSIAGTVSAAWQYSRKISIPWRLAIPASTAALLGAAGGAALVSFIPSAALRPIVLILLALVLAYTLLKPDFGKLAGKAWLTTNQQAWAAGIGFGLGLYDGFFGPGTGSFLIFSFVRLFGMDLLHASASAKYVNLATNLAALIFFLAHQGVMWQLGLAMAVANITGAQLGTWVALRHGNRFIRSLLIIVVAALILKLSWDLLR